MGKQRLRPIAPISGPGRKDGAIQKRVALTEAEANTTAAPTLAQEKNVLIKEDAVNLGKFSKLGDKNPFELGPRRSGVSTVRIRKGHEKSIYAAGDNLKKAQRYIEEQNKGRKLHFAFGGQLNPVKPIR